MFFCWNLDLLNIFITWWFWLFENFIFLKNLPFLFLKFFKIYFSGVSNHSYSTTLIFISLLAVVKISNNGIFPINYWICGLPTGRQKIIQKKLKGVLEPAWHAVFKNTQYFKLCIKMCEKLIFEVNDIVTFLLYN